MSSPSRPPVWLITGAQGFLGANLGAFLAGRVHRVGSSRDGDVPRGLFDGAIAGNLLNPTDLVARIEHLSPDVIVNAAAMAVHEACEADPATAEQVNAGSAAAISEAAERCGARVVHISTDAVFDGERGKYTELDEPHPTSVYGATKLLGEQRVSRNSDALVIRTNFFGWSPSGQRSILEFFVNELSAGREVRGFVDFAVTSAYAQVLAETIWSLVGSAASGTFHVTSPDTMSKYEFGVAVAEAFALDSALITPAAMDLDPPRGRDLSLDVTKVQAWLGASLPSQRDGIERARADESLLRHTISASH